ncbi:UNVERIFIED_CONTAM: hypothetical protein Sangu_0452700 [Sesamum angustifolium]|uniref:Uncharacterized protein n=1 Tax=Sesamum angustifolium TaxID=2727405 RepID=A0AAW2QTR6_9LAMI
MPACGPAHMSNQYGLWRFLEEPPPGGGGAYGRLSGFQNYGSIGYENGRGCIVVQG